MFRRFRPKLRVYENRRHGCSFKATINFLIWNDVDLVGLQNCYLGFWKFWKFLKSFKIFNIFFLFQNFPPQNQNFQKKSYNMLEGNGWWICPQNFKWISSKMAEIWWKTCKKNRHFSRHFGTLPWLSECYFLTDFDAFKGVLGSFFAFFLRKSDLKTCIAAVNHEKKNCLTFFTWWPEMTLTSIMVAKHSKWYLQMSEKLSMPISWLCSCLTSQFCSPMSPSPNVEHFYFDLTCDVTRDPEVNKICFPKTVSPGLSNAAWIFRIGPVVSEIRGGGSSK